MKILVTAGGGGHFAAALAVMQKFPKEWEVLFVGRKRLFEGSKTEPFEIKTVRELGIPYKMIESARLQRTFNKHTILSLFKLPSGLLQAREIITNFHPDVVISFGGYITVPLVFVAKRMGIPAFIHEQILHAGLANKIAARFATKIFISWEQSRKYFRHKQVILTGNPIRENAFKAERLSKSESVQYVKKLFSIEKIEKPILFITGGSGGSHALNMLIEDSLPELLEKYVVIQQTGDAKEFTDFDRLMEKRKTLPSDQKSRYILTKFVNPQDMSYVVHASDLILSRAGINTVTELIYLEKKALLVPLILSRFTEQLFNAQFFKTLGLGDYLLQKTTTKDVLLKKLDHLSKLPLSVSKEVLSYKEHIATAADTIVEIISRYDISTKTHPETE